MRLIDADALIKDITNSAGLGGELGKVVEVVKAYTKFMVATAPTVQPAQPETKKGTWIPQDFNKHYGMTSTSVYYYPKCSMCGESANYTNFCPHCGADMRGEDYEID